jgi:outer membrane receptor for ferrienterochelin and colicins
MESPVPVEVYKPVFSEKPTANIFEALQNVNGVRQLNCNVCNTGDIHINGLEGPYTLVLIDGMPIVSGLSTVYGLSGIPTPY